MKELLDYINGLNAAERLEFELRIGTTTQYLRKACSKGQKLGAALSVRIEDASDGKVTRKHLHPLDWADMWPELKDVA